MEIHMSEKLDKTGQNRTNGGRPTKKQQAEMEAKLRNFFEMNMSASLTASQPGLPNRHTVEKYFSRFATKLHDSYNIDTNERQKMAKLKYINACRRLIFKLEYQLNAFENLIEEDRQNQLLKSREAEAENRPEGVEPYAPKMEWEYMKKKLVEAIEVFQDKMAATDAQPTVYEEDEEEVLRHLEAKAERLLDVEIDKKHRNKYNKETQKSQPKDSK